HLLIKKILTRSLQIGPFKPSFGLGGAVLLQDSVFALLVRAFSRFIRIQSLLTYPSRGDWDDLLSASRQGHDLIGAYADACAAAKGFDNRTTSGAYSCCARGFADADVIACHLELDLAVRQEAELVANLLRDGQLSFSLDSHGMAPAD